MKRSSNLSLKRKKLRRKSSLKNLQSLETLTEESSDHDQSKEIDFISCAQVPSISNSSHNEVFNSSEVDLFNLSKTSQQSVSTVLSESICKNLDEQFFSPEKNCDVLDQDTNFIPIDETNKKRYLNDSIFGDVDLSYFEKACECDKENDNENVAFKAKCVDNKTMDKNLNSNSPILCLTPVKNTTPEKNICSPQNIGNSGGPLAQKLLQRLQANAKIRTPRQARQYENLLNRSKINSEMEIKENASKENSEALAIENINTQDIGPFYGLPSVVRDLLLEVKGIKSVYEWQHKCLTLPSLRNGKNLIYSLPTSGGKTLVAEILIMKTLLCSHKDAILVLPFVAIVQEKVRGIAQFADRLNFLVEEYAGSKGKIPPRKRRKCNSLFICTIEKANSVVNSLIEANRLDDIGMIVVDELHMIGEGGRRGATIEMMLSNTMFISATLKNISEIAAFLKADVYTNNFRPVELQEHLKIDSSIYKIDGNLAIESNECMSFHRSISHKNKTISNRDPDHIVSLLLEVIPDHSCLIFCATKKTCENLATMVSKLLPKSLKERKTKEKLDLLNLLYKESGETGVCSVLRASIPFGIAYHHSGLTSDERRLIEDAYTEGVLSVLTCTSTLAAGVNLPARRVIIRSPYVGGNFLSRVQYKQMIGRAGRTGLDPVGESFLILTKPKDKMKVKELVAGSLETCISSLMYDGGKGFKTLLLNLIGLKMKMYPDYFFKDQEKNNVKELATKYLQELVDLNLVRVRKHEKKDTGDVEYIVEATKLGEATFRGSIDLDLANNIYKDLKTGLNSLVLSCFMHLLYLVTPHDSVSGINPNWMIYFEEYGRLEPGEQKTANVLGITEAFLATKAAGHRIRKKKVDEFVAARFYVTIMLNMLFQGQNLYHVANRFNQTRGFLQNLLASASSFATRLVYFTKELEDFWPYQALLDKLVQTLQFCKTVELIPLMEIPGVKLGRARQLYNAGFKTFTHIAKTDVKILMKKIENLPRKQALQIISSAKIILKDKLDELQAEAEELQKVPF